MEPEIYSTESLQQRTIKLCNEAANAQLDSTSPRDNNGFSFEARRKILEASIAMTLAEEQGHPIRIHEHICDFIGDDGENPEDQRKISCLFNTLPTLQMEWKQDGQPPMDFVNHMHPRTWMEDGEGAAPEFMGLGWEEPEWGEARGPLNKKKKKRKKPKLMEIAELKKMEAEELHEYVRMLFSTACDKQCDTDGKRDPHGVSHSTKARIQKIAEIYRLQKMMINDTSRSPLVHTIPAECALEAAVIMKCMETYCSTGPQGIRFRVVVKGAAADEEEETDDWDACTLHQKTARERWNEICRRWEGTEIPNAEPLLHVTTYAYYQKLLHEAEVKFAEACKDQCDEEITRRTEGHPDCKLAAVLKIQGISDICDIVVLGDPSAWKSPFRYVIPEEYKQEGETIAFMVNRICKRLTTQLRFDKETRKFLEGEKSKEGEQEQAGMESEIIVMDRYGTPSNPVEWFDDLPGYIEFLLAQKRATEEAKDPEVSKHRLRHGFHYDYDDSLEHPEMKGKKQDIAGAKSGVEKTSP